MEKVNQLPLFIDEKRTDIFHLLGNERTLLSYINDFYSCKANPNLRAFVQNNMVRDIGETIDSLPGNLSAGKNTSVYDAHTYHTKVPPQAICRLIEHYSKPGELVLDPFCGSGMTGVAAVQTGRKPILIDLSPAATFIALNFLSPVDAVKYIQVVKRILSSLLDEELNLYGTHCRSCGKLVPMEYMVWSYGLLCEFCDQEFLLWDVARAEGKTVRESKIRTEFDCPHCGRHLKKKQLKRTKLYPVEVGYHCCNFGMQEMKAVPDEYDLEVIRRADEIGVRDGIWYPTDKLPWGVNTRQAIFHGLDSIDALYTKRNLSVAAQLWNIARRWPDKEISLALMFTVTSLYQRITKLSEFRFWGGSGNIANYNVPMIFNEQNVFKVFHRKAKTILLYLNTWSSKPTSPFCISTQSATNLKDIPDNSIDYVFTDPPFGGNINYSEMNYLWESWLGVYTDNSNEAIINKAQKKTVNDYQRLMTLSLSEIYRVLKPGKWLTLVFHNSSANVWSAIQEALNASAFTVNSTHTLDKRHGTFKQFVSENAVGYDLMIHCRKEYDKNNHYNLIRSETSRNAISEFVVQILVKHPETFIIHYLHVNRGNEIDYRKLYAFWLKDRTEKEVIVDIDYEEFRNIAASIIKERFPQFWKQNGANPK